MRSCFEGFITKNLMVRSKFNLDIWFRSYDCIHTQAERSEVGLRDGPSARYSPPKLF